MANIPSALTFLESVAGYSQMIGLAEVPSANTPIRLAVIDPAYVASSYPTTLPRVTFEGEETLSDKRYLVISRAYKPVAGDRVVMLPAGHTYVIVGVVSPAEVAPNFDSQDATGIVTTASTSFVSLTGGPSATITLRAGQYARVIVGCQLFPDTSGATGAVMSFRSTGASGTVEAIDANGGESDNPSEWTPMSRTTIWGPASSAGSHTFESRYKIIGPATANYKNRRITAEAL